MTSEVCREVVHRSPRSGAYPPTTSWFDPTDYTATQLCQLLRSSRSGEGAPRLASRVSLTGMHAKQVLIKSQNATASLISLKASGCVESARSAPRILWCVPCILLLKAHALNHSQSCVLCPNEGGAFKQTVNGDWIHLLCAMWIPETQVVNETVMEPIANLDRVNKARYRLVCVICPYCIRPANEITYRNVAFVRSRTPARASNAIGPAASLPSMLPALASAYFYNITDYLD